MNKLFVILVLIVVLVVGVAGCGGAHCDNRLAAADSLMQTSPDSALAIVSAIDSLRGEGDRAYRDLLLTQARYKAYREITAGDDSAVTRAMAWYRAHGGEREKLTRAYLYKGAVMQELGHVDSAMHYYKTAELTADPKDYANLGQINTRIGALYRDYYVDPQICYDLFKRALNYYRLTRDKRMQYDCLRNMGGCSGIIRIGNPEQLLSEASQLAIELGDSAKYYQCQELLCRQLAYYGDSIARAKHIAFHCLNNYGQFINEDLMLDLAEIYAKSEMPDSARYYLAYADASASAINPEQIKARKYSILSRITHLEGGMNQSNHNDMLSHQVTDSILNSNLRYQIQQIENTFDNRRHTGFLSQISRLHWAMIGLSVFALIIITMLLIAYMRRIRNTKAIIKELENNYNPTRINVLLNQFDAKNKSIGHLVTNLVSILKSCVAEADKRGFTSQLAQQIKEKIVDVADDNFWNELRSYLDNEHNGMITNIAKNPNITAKDLRFIELACCDFTYLEMAIILDYTPRYVLNKRKLIAKKMGIQIPLLDYLSKQMQGKGQQMTYLKQ